MLAVQDYIQPGGKKLQKLLNYLHGEQTKNPQATTIFFQKNQYQGDVTEYSVYLPAQFNIKFKGLGQFDFSALSVNVEAIILIRIFCLGYSHLLDQIQKNPVLLYEDGSIQKLTPQNCSVFNKDAEQGYIEFVIAKTLPCVIQPKLIYSPFQRIKLYSYIQFKTLSFIHQSGKKNKTTDFINIKINFPNFAIDQYTRNEINRSHLWQNKQHTKRDSKIGAIKPSPAESQQNIKQPDQSNPQAKTPAGTKQDAAQDNIESHSRLETSTVSVPVDKATIKPKIDNNKTIDFARSFQQNYYQAAANACKLYSFYYDQQSQADTIKQKMTQLLSQRQRHGHCFNQVRIKLLIFKQPITTLVSIMLPMGLLSFINCAIFFQTSDISSRVAALASLLIAYGTTVLQIRRQIVPGRELTLMQGVLYIQTLCCILTLVQSFLIKNDDASTYQQTFHWYRSALFLIVFIVAILSNLIFVFLSIKYCVWDKPKFTNPNKKKGQQVDFSRFYNYENFFIKTKKQVKKVDIRDSDDEQQQKGFFSTFKFGGGRN